MYVLREHPDERLRVVYYVQSRIQVNVVCLRRSTAGCEFRNLQVSIDEIQSSLPLDAPYCLVNEWGCRMYM